MTPDTPEAISFHPEKRSKKHPHEPGNDLDSYHPRRNCSMTATTFTMLQEIGDERHELIPAECLCTADTLASPQKKRFLDISLHEDTTEAAYARSCEKKSHSK